ncbi:MAG: OmpH family outer membrane protein [Akkermansia sp.]
MTKIQSINEMMKIDGLACLCHLTETLFDTHKKMNFLNKTLIAVSALTLVATANAELKIATVDVQKLFKDYYKTHDAQKELDGERAKVQENSNTRVAKIQAIEKELQELKKQIEDPSISEKAKKELTDQFQLKNNEGVALDQERRQFLERRNRSLGEQMKVKLTAIVEEINKVTNDAAQKGEFDIVFDSSAQAMSQTKVLMFAKDKFDITPKVMKALNADAPKGFDPSKSATPAPVAPAAAAPASK